MSDFPPNLVAVGAEAPRTDLPELLSRLVESVSDYAIVLLDVRGHIMTWNPGAEKMKGWHADEIIGQSFERFYTPEALAIGHPQRELETAAMTGHYQENGWRVRRDGTRFWANIAIHAIYDETGNLEGFGKVTRDLTAQKQNEEQLLNTLALLDAAVRMDVLTGLPNRRAWDEATVRELARAGRTGGPLCVAMIDVDDFKAFNDSRGHGAGDRFLKQCAFLWRRSLRLTDTLARYGGEEFSVILPDCSQADALVILERLRGTTPEGQTCSCGVAQWDGTESADDLLGRADRALYRAKDDGRNRAVGAA